MGEVKIIVRRCFVESLLSNWYYSKILLNWYPMGFPAPGIDSSNIVS